MKVKVKCLFAAHGVNCELVDSGFERLSRADCSRRMRQRLRSLRLPAVPSTERDRHTGEYHLHIYIHIFKKKKKR